MLHRYHLYRDRAAADGDRRGGWWVGVLDGAGGAMKLEHRATNGIWVTFICRYHDDNFYRIREVDGAERELTVNDDGSMRLMFNGPIPKNWVDAYEEYKAKEAAEFEEWKSKNAHLFA